MNYIFVYYYPQIANDSASILDYFADTFGEMIVRRSPVIVGKPEWYFIG